MSHGVLCFSMLSVLRSYEILIVLSVFNEWRSELGAGACDVMIMLLVGLSDFPGLVLSCQCEPYTEAAGEE